MRVVYGNSVLRIGPIFARNFWKNIFRIVQLEKKCLQFEDPFFSWQNFGGDGGNKKKKGISLQLPFLISQKVASE